MRRPIIDDARFVASVRGESYGVLLVPDAILRACDEAQRVLRGTLSGLDVVYPRAHLTLASFARGSELREVQAALDRWARYAPPLHLRLQNVDAFGPPHRVLYARVRKTLDLERAYAGLRREGRSRGLEPVGGEAGAIPATRWTPHLSLAYCGRLDEAGWRRARAASRAARLPAVEGSATAVELVTYDAGGERFVASLPLRGADGG